MAPQPGQQPLSASQLQTLLQQQALLLQQLYKKQQLQLQLQLPHQHPHKKVKEVSLPQLMFQQLLRLQHYQQQLLGLQRPTPPCPAAPQEVHQIWKELVNGLREDKSTKKDWTTCAAHSIKTPATEINNPRSPSPLHTECGSEAASHPLYAHGLCNWPGCEFVCENISHFLKHLLSEHTLDDRTTAQCRVQMQVVRQLDLQLSRERERLQAMMTHLHLPPLGAPSLAAPVAVPPPQSETADDPFSQQPRINVSSSSPCPGLQETVSPVGAPSRGLAGLGGGSPTRNLGGWGAMRRLHRPSLSSLSSDDEFELYRNTDIRPPFTYATLIRQAIMTASEKQLTLNEIYNWFTCTFAFFRRNAATWKNAVRHNLSLHKCFVRVENVKGAVWTVDEVEFQRRRSQKITGSPSTMKHVSSSLPIGSSGVGLQPAVAETILPGVQCISRGLVGHSERNTETTLCSSHVQQPGFMKKEVLSSEEQEDLGSPSPCSTLNDP